MLRLRRALYNHIGARSRPVRRAEFRAFFVSRWSCASSDKNGDASKHNEKLVNEARNEHEAAGLHPGSFPPSQRSGDNGNGGNGNSNNLGDDVKEVRVAKNRSSLYYILAASFVMLGLSYAAVPVYRIFCQVTGFGGTTQRAEKAKRVNIDRSREFKVHFRGVSDVKLPWEFKPLQSSVDVFPGESTLAFYTATNLSSKPLIGVAMYTVHPPNAGLYFTKIECFCFDEQRINPHETVNMPVLFRIDPEIVNDRTLKNDYDIYLNYTFFLSNDQNIYFDEDANEFRTTSDVLALQEAS